MKPCGVAGCAKPAGVPGTAKGLCTTHYHRLRRTGDPLLTLADLKPKPDPFCSIQGCGRKRWARGLCTMHLYRLRTRGAPGGPDAEWQPRVGTCRIDGCDSPVKFGIHRLCSAHYQRQFKCGGEATIDQLEARVAYYGGLCWICGAPWEQLDHVKPVKAGGPNLPANFRPACGACNNRKRSRWFGANRLHELVAYVREAAA